MVLRFGGEDVTLRWVVVGADTVSIAIDREGETVTGASAVVHVTAPTTWTLTGANAVGSVTATTSVAMAAPSPVTVSGRVLALSLQPVPNQQIVIPGHETVTTDADGRFTIANVKPPYDLISIDLGMNRADVFKGLTRSDPILPHGAMSLGPERTATLSGTLVGGVSQAGTNAWFRSDEGAGSSVGPGPAFALDGSSETHQKATWFGPPTTTGKLYALQVTYDAGVITGFPSFASGEDMTLEDGAVLSSLQLTTVVPATQTMSASITVPSGYTFKGGTVSVTGTADTRGPHIWTIPEQISSFSSLFPDVPGLDAFLGVSATKEGVYHSTLIRFVPSTRVSGLQVIIPASPIALQPADGATGVSGSTLFSWEPYRPAHGLQPAQGIHGLHLWRTNETDPTIYVFTMDTSVSLPDLSAYGLRLPQGARYQWAVEGYGPVDSIDALASGWFLALHAGRLQSEATLAMAAFRDLTTQ